MSADIPPEPQPLPARESAPQVGRRVVLLGAGVLLLGAAYASQRDSWVPVEAGRTPVAATEMPPQLAARYEAAFANAHSVLKPVDLSSDAARDEVMSLIPAPPEQARLMINDALLGKRPLGRVVVWDNMTEDGDVVRLDCGGISVTVTLRKAGDVFVFPYDPGSTMSISGVHDGGGGITVAVGLASGPVPLPPLRVGEVRHLPLY